jgi:hypothetical protein
MKSHQWEHKPEFDGLYGIGVEMYKCKRCGLQTFPTVLEMISGKELNVEDYPDCDLVLISRVQNS